MADGNLEDSRGFRMGYEEFPVITQRESKNKAVSDNWEGPSRCCLEISFGVRNEIIL